MKIKIIRAQVEKGNEVQETSTHVQGGNFRHNVQDEFQVELNRVRNSLTALTLRNFMMRDEDEEGSFVENKEILEGNEKMLKFPDYPEELLRFEEGLKMGKAMKWAESDGVKEKLSDDDKSSKKLSVSSEKLSKSTEKLSTSSEKLFKSTEKLSKSTEKHSKLLTRSEKLSEKPSRFKEDQRKLLKSPKVPEGQEKLLKLPDSPEKLLNLNNPFGTESKLTKNKTYQQIEFDLPVEASKKLPESSFEQEKLSKFPESPQKLHKPKNFDENFQNLSVPIKPISEVPDFRRSLSKHRQDAIRTQSTFVDPNDVLFALTASQEKLESEKPKVVRFVEKPKKLLTEPSRDSDEIATIICGETELPWQKKHQYRTVTPFLKPKTEEIAFRPIESSLSTEDVNLEILKPVPIFASKSFQELPRASWDFQPFDHFHTKSSDDLLMSNIDGARKPESKRHRMMRIRSESNGSLNAYENFRYELPQPATANFLRQKPPQPLPRTSSKTIVYVLDKHRDEFVLEDPSSFEEVYEDVQWRSSDSILFNSLVDSRDDRKLLRSRT